MSRYPTEPPLECDLVMKGGVTSGVLYPTAVCELATTYRFRSVGGTSAGAIAAAATAAAEVGRASGGFERLAGLPHRLTEPCANGRSTLFNLFQPARDRGSARLFGVLTAGMRTPAAPRRAAAAALVRGYAGRMGVGVVPGLALLLLGVVGGGWASVLAGGIGGVVVAAIGVLAAAASGLWSDLGQVRRFGLCAGMPGTPTRGRGPVGAPAPLALTPWLHRELQTLAGLDPDGDPLTFGHLQDAGVELRMMTTDLTQGQPVTMPWLNREYFFDPAEFAELFPPAIVEWMVDHAPAADPSPGEAFATAVRRLQNAPLLPWPDARDLPVLVATRMSLSFPGLLQAVPLHATNWAHPDNRAASAAVDEWRRQQGDTDPARAAAEVPPARRQRTWFSDGGICANLPVHLFDSPLPGRPTFAINLDPFGDTRRRSDDEAENSYLPAGSGGGRFRPWRTLDDARPAGLLGFGGAILDTARNWVDEQQLTMPGYSGRVVTIFQGSDEGGLNLDMPPEVVGHLAARGAGAGRRLLDRFAGPEPGVRDAEGWTLHRWTRLRLTLAGYQQWVDRFATAYSRPAPAAVRPGDRPGYPDLLALHPDDLPGYRPSATHLAELARHAADLAADAAGWDPDAAADAAPRPRPALRLTPELDESRR